MSKKQTKLGQELIAGMKEITEAPEFTYNTVAFTPVFNKERKEYDMYCIKLNTETNEVELDIEECSYAEHHRAMTDLNLRNINEMNRQLKLKGK